MSRVFKEIACVTCHDMFVVSENIESPWQCGGCESDAINGTIDWTPDAETEAEYDEFEDEFETETDRTDELIADLKQQLDTALADLESERVAGDAMEDMLKELETMYDAALDDLDLAIAGWQSGVESAEALADLEKAHDRLITQYKNSQEGFRYWLDNWFKRQWEADIYADR
jgi:hypothetical protein